MHDAVGADTNDCTSRNHFIVDDKRLVESWTGFTPKNTTKTWCQT